MQKHSEQRKMRRIKEISDKTRQASAAFSVVESQKRKGEYGRPLPADGEGPEHELKELMRAEEKSTAMRARPFQP